MAATGARLTWFPVGHLFISSNTSLKNPKGQQNSRTAISEKWTLISRIHFRNNSHFAAQATFQGG